MFKAKDGLVFQAWQFSFPLKINLIFSSKVI